MIRKTLLVLAASVLVTASGVALALPATAPDATLGTNGKVRALVQVGNVMWVGGQFTATSDGQGGLSNIVGLDVTTGQRAAVSNPQLTGAGSIVYDLTTDGAGTVYAAGTFTAANTSKNLVAFDGLTGTLTQSFNRPPALKSVLFDNGRVLGGSPKLQAWLPTGAKDPSWDVTVLHTDSTLRAHTTLPSYRDLEPIAGGGYFAACQCDSLTDAGITYQTKAIVRLDANGTYDPTWVPGGSDPLRDTSAAFGIDALTEPDGVVLAAGGSDFAEKFDLTTGDRVWKTDTNGSAQAVALYTDAQGSDYFIGGHYRCLSDTGTGGNETDFFHPRLSALDLNGVLDKSWTVPITPIYNGVWVLAQDTLGNLWVGGEFKKVGGNWSGDSTNTCANGKPTAKNQIARTYVTRFPGPVVTG
jgi:hypothetical protein